MKRGTAPVLAAGPPGAYVSGPAVFEPVVRIAGPLLLVTTPVGVVWGILEAWRFHWWLAVLMAALVAVIGAFAWLTVSRIRRERDDGFRPPPRAGRTTAAPATMPPGPSPRGSSGDSPR